MTHDEEAVLARIDRDEVISLLSDLVQIKSISPPGDTRAAVDFLAQRLADSGIPYTITFKESPKSSLLASVGANDDGPELLLHGHLDTMPAGDLTQWTSVPFSGEIRDGRVYGRGAGDDKASVVAQLMALVALARSNINLRGRISLAAVADEELGGLLGTKWLHDEGILRPDALIVGESTHNQLAIAERELCRINLTVFGRSAHGATPWLGDNAILSTARVLTYIDKNLTSMLESKRHPFLPPATLNVGYIRGGVERTVVPDFCTVEIDRRVLPGESGDSALGEIRAVLERYAREVEPIRYEIAMQGEVARNIDTAPDHPFVRFAMRCLEELTGQSRPVVGFMQSSDGKWFAGDDIPIAIFGPGDPALAHANDEYVEVEEVVEATQFLTLLALRWPYHASE